MSVISVVNFRLLSLEDAKSLRALNEATHPGIAQSEEYWKDLLSSVGVPSNVGAFNRKKELIGAVTTIPDLILSSTGKKMAHPEELLLLQSHRKVAYISHLMVADSMRRRGIATQLMRKIMEKLRDAGAEALCLHTHTGNTAAVRLYEKLGFQNEARYTPDRDSNAMFFVYRISEFSQFEKTLESQ